MTEQSGDGLADFVRGLPDGQRHNGFFWAVSTAVEDGLPPGEVDKVAQAGVTAGLGEAYVKRTITEVQEAETVGKQILKKKPKPKKPKPG